MVPHSLLEQGLALDLQAFPLAHSLPNKLAKQMNNSSHIIQLLGQMEQTPIGFCSG